MASVVAIRAGSRRRSWFGTGWRSTGRWGCAVATIGILAVTGCAEHPSSSAAKIQVPSGLPHITNARRLLVPSSGDLFGAWVKPAKGFTAEDEEAAVTSLDHALHRKLAIDNIYANWTAPMPVTVARWDLRRGIVPMISWASASTTKINEGVYDKQIRAQARQLRSLHRPVMLRWFYEMNDAYNHRFAVSPTSFVAAWRRVHRIFTAAGATNVLWVWCPSAYGFADGTAQPFYPGKSYVDWIGADGYNWAPERPDTPWRSFAQIFAGFDRWGFSSGKPLLIGEYGVLEGSPGEKAEWFAQAEQNLKTEFRAIRAVVYFDSSRRNPHFGGYFNWNVKSSPSALAAFRAFATDPYFTARPLN